MSTAEEVFTAIGKAHDAAYAQAKESARILAALEGFFAQNGWTNHQAPEFTGSHWYATAHVSHNDANEEERLKTACDRLSALGWYVSINDWGGGSASTLLSCTIDHAPELH